MGPIIAEVFGGALLIAAVLAIIVTVTAYVKSNFPPSENSK
jgi:hypothetical protein